MTGSLKWGQVFGAGAALLTGALTIAPAAWSDPPQIEMSHRFLSWTESPDGQIGGAEYEFTITNLGATGLYDVRIMLGIDVPEPTGTEGDPSLRIAMLESGEMVTVAYAVTVRTADAHRIAIADLVGSVEAIEGQGGAIERASIVSRSGDAL